MNSLSFLSQPSQNICARVSASQDQILAGLLLTVSKLKDSNTNCYSVYKHCHLADPLVCCSLRECTIDFKDMNISKAPYKTL